MKFLILITIAVSGHAWGDLVIPPGLKLGAGSSAYQVEGAWNAYGKSPSVVDMIYANQCNESSKSYELWRTDVELIKDLGLQLYRFSIPWTRILPTGRPDYINQEAVEHYSQLIDALIEINVEPVVTILHFDLPLSLRKLGGWHNPGFPDWLADYSRVLFSLYGDRVKTWLTFNEPLMVCYFNGNNQAQATLCSKNVLLGHAKAWRVYDKEFRKKQNGEITIIINLTWMEPDTEDDEPLADLLMQYYGGLYSNPIFSKEGGWPKDLQKALAGTKAALPELTFEEIELIKGTHDFYAFNYYTAQVIRKALPSEAVGPWPLRGCPELGAVYVKSSHKFKTNKCIPRMPIYPEGIRAVMNWTTKQYGVTRYLVGENGLATNGIMKDQEKIIFIQDHLRQLVLAIEKDGVDVFGYIVWSLLDSFEFHTGYKSKYGLYRVDFEDPLRARSPRDSAFYYKALISNARNGRPTKLVTEDGTSGSNLASINCHLILSVSFYAICAII